MGSPEVVYKDAGKDAEATKKVDEAAHIPSKQGQSHMKYTQLRSDGETELQHSENRAKDI
eukprot:2907937-Amphidinium_carterae.1